MKEPEAEHITLAESLVFSRNPSARADFPGGITLTRQYDRLEVLQMQDAPAQAILPMEGSLELPHWGLTVTCSPAREIVNTSNTFTVYPKGPVCIRSRRPGDEIRLPGGTRSLKKLFIDRKIPALQRPLVPVIADREGILGIYGIGVNTDRAARTLPAVSITLTPLNPAER